VSDFFKHKKNIFELQATQFLEHSFNTELFNIDTLSKVSISPEESDFFIRKFPDELYDFSISYTSPYINDWIIPNNIAYIRDYKITYDKEQELLNGYFSSLKETHDSKFYFLIRDILAKRKQRLLNIISKLKSNIRHLHREILISTNGYRIKFLRHIIRSHFKTMSDSGSEEDAKLIDFQNHQFLFNPILIRITNEKTRKRITYKSN
jgi:hypothetical protein